MNALILSCNTGEGHNSCARAIKDCFERHGDSCRIEDALGFISKGASRFISRWHVRMYRHMPWLFRLGYRFSENHPGRLDDGTLPYRFIGEGTEALCRYIIQNHIDTVICPHVFSAIMVTELREKYPSLQFKSCFIATDYTCSPGTESISTDLFFVPDKRVVDNDLLVSPEQVLDSGMPVRACFYESAGKKQAREQLGYNAEGSHLLMMCGSMGCGPMKELASLLASRLREGQTLTIVCGTNKKLFRWMNKNFHGRRDIHVIEYTNDISLLMDSADLYLTKPGGLSTSEAAAKNLPMVLVNAVSGCEEYNLRYFVQTGLAQTADGPEELADLCIRLLSDPERLEAMRAAGQQIPRKNSAERIYAALSGLSGEKEGIE